MIPKSNNTKTGFFQYIRPDVVFPQTFLMLTSINFNNKLFFKAYKIENVVFKRVLSAKFQSINLTSS